MDVVAETEAAFVAQWSSFGRWDRGELHEEDGVLWFETPIRHLPYNGVLHTRLPDGEAADAAIARVLARYRDRSVQCVWFVHPSSTPANLGARLEAHGLRAVERMTYMSLELGPWVPPPLPAEVAFVEVADEEALAEYTRLAADYWEIPEHERPAVAELQRQLGPGRLPGRRYLALAEGRAVGKAYLSFAGPPGVAAVYGMSVVPEARGRGIGGGMTTTLLRHAREAGCRRMVLHSSPVAVRLYRRAGFTVHRVLPVYATAPIWSGTH